MPSGAGPVASVCSGEGKARRHSVSLPESRSDCDLPRAPRSRARGPGRGTVQLNPLEAVNRRQARGAWRCRGGGAACQQRGAVCTQRPGLPGDPAGHFPHFLPLGSRPQAAAWSSDPAERRARPQLRPSARGRRAAGQVYLEGLRSQGLGRLRGPELTRCSQNPGPRYAGRSPRHFASQRRESRAVSPVKEDAAGKLLMLATCGNSCSGPGT